MHNLSFENEFYLNVNDKTYSYESLCTKTSFQKEVQDNSTQNTPEKFLKRMFPKKGTGNKIQYADRDRREDIEVTGNIRSHTSAHLVKHFKKCYFYYHRNISMLTDNS